MANELNGKVAVVTGGTSGIGKAICEAFVAAGSKVVFTGLEHQDRIDHTAAEIGAGAIGRKIDAGSVAAMAALLDDVKATHGRLDVLVANAGVGLHAPLGKITEEQFDTMIRTNVKGVLFATQSALPLMEAGASIIWVGSTGSDRPVPGMSVYCGNKAALRAMAQSVIHDIKGSGIRINVLSPGPTDTESLRGAFEKAGGKEGVEKAISQIEERSPVGRIGAPSEVAAVAVFLASDASSYVDGAELFVDGGSRSAS